MPKPVLGPIPPASKQPNRKEAPDKRRWAFSFRYWRQHENFGIGSAEARWFMSLLARMQEMSKLAVEDVMEDFATKEGLRIHDINWAAKNIPISREDIDWVDDVYWKNKAEYPLMQFHISMGLGRVAGFLDENSIFNVVLLDPMHNLQPSKFNGHRIRATTFGECAFTTVVNRVESFARKHSDLTNEARAEILRILSEQMQSDGRPILLIPVDRKMSEDIQGLIEMSGGAPESFLANLIDEAIAKLA